MLVPAQTCYLLPSEVHNISGIVRKEISVAINLQHCRVALAYPSRVQVLTDFAFSIMITYKEMNLTFELSDILIDAVTTEDIAQNVHSVIILYKTVPVTYNCSIMLCHGRISTSFVDELGIMAEMKVACKIYHSLYLYDHFRS